MSVGDLPGVPLGFGLLPPLGQDGLLVVSDALELAVGILRRRAGRFFRTHHVLKVDTEQRHVSVTRILSGCLLFSSYFSI